jgi:hypothetical protein
MKLFARFSEEPSHFSGQGLGRICKPLECAVGVNSEFRESMPRCKFEKKVRDDIIVLFWEKIFDNRNNALQA